MTGSTSPGIKPAPVLKQQAGKFSPVTCKFKKPVRQQLFAVADLIILHFLPGGQHCLFVPDHIESPQRVLPDEDTLVDYHTNHKIHQAVISRVTFVYAELLYKTGKISLLNFIPFLIYRD